MWLNCWSISFTAASSCMKSCSLNLCSRLKAAGDTMLMNLIGGVLRQSA